MDFVINTSATATFTALLVALFKAGYPAAASWLLILVSLASGIVCAVLVAVAADVVLIAPHVAQVVLSGVLAAAGAAGVTRTDAAASALRERERVV